MFVLLFEFIITLVVFVKSVIDSLDNMSMVSISYNEILSISSVCSVEFVSM